MTSGRSQTCRNGEHDYSSLIFVDKTKATTKFRLNDDNNNNNNNHDNVYGAVIMT